MKIKKKTNHIDKLTTFLLVAWTFIQAFKHRLAIGRGCSSKSLSSQDPSRAAGSYTNKLPLQTQVQGPHRLRTACDFKHTMKKPVPKIKEAVSLSFTRLQNWAEFKFMQWISQNSKDRPPSSSSARSTEREAELSCQDLPRQTPPHLLHSLHVTAWVAAVWAYVAPNLG